MIQSAVSLSRISNEYRFHIDNVYLTFSSSFICFSEALKLSDSFGEKRVIIISCE